jgi:trigger factor
MGVRLNQAATEAKNEKINVSMTNQPGSRIVLEISVTPEATKTSYSKAIKAINKEVSLPGFRKGKAPDKFIVEKYGKQVEQEWRSLVIQNGFEEALELLKLRPFKRETIKCTEVKEVSHENGAKFTIEFEASPQMPNVKIEGLTIKNIEKKPIKDADIDQVIQNALYYYAQWKDITDRPVQEGDFIDLDIDKLDEPKENICRDSRFAVKEGQMAGWMRSMVIGLQANESAEGISELDDLATPEAAANFVPTRCRITVKSIKEATLPEINDEFAQKTGVPTVAELRQRIAADLERRAEQDIKGHMYRQVDEWLLQNYEIDIPSSLIQQEKESRLSEVIDRLQKQNAPADVIAKRALELEETLPRDVDRNYRIFFLLMSFAQQHNLTVTNEELAEELSQQIMQGNNPGIFGQDADEVRARVSQQLILRKSRDHIIEHAKKD